MSKVLIKVKAGENYNDTDIRDQITRVTLTNQPLTASFNPVTRTLAAGAKSTTDALLVTSGTDYDTTTEGVLHTYRAIVVPNNYSGDVTVTGNDASETRTIVFYIGDVTYTYNITSAFVPGQQITFTVTLDATGMSVSASITEWSTATDSKTLYPVANS